ncbi:D-ribose-binding periplasmic protein precursor [Cedecea neteri]|uniref:D-ribose-binding periplasmic protein n=1 Tax=Cedecea neteri TaxID=158822 RepID=A0A2X2TAU0_9ENTR|nr:D-ribose-binding periplasmic protein precursor [Cedecea neteri]
MKKLILAALIALTTAPALAENEQIVFSTPNLAMPFEVHMQRTAVQAAKEMGVKLQVLDSQGSSPKQVADLENAITRGAQGFIVSPNDVNAVSSAVGEIQDARLPVVTLDRSVASDKPVPHFGANNYKGGQAVADFVKAKFPDGADIVLLTGQPGSSSNIERTKGIRDGLKAGALNTRSSPIRPGTGCVLKVCASLKACCRRCRKNLRSFFPPTTIWRSAQLKRCRGRA